MSHDSIKGHQHARHAGREDLTGEHRLGDTLQIIFLILFLAIWVLDSFVLHFSDFLSDDIPAYIRWPLGGILSVFALRISRAGLQKIFNEVREKPSVVREGVFSWVRHPIYSAAILLYFAFLVTTLSLVSAGLFLVITGFYWLISRHEEKLLIQRFGQEYLDYKKEVPMLFPIKISR